MEAIYFLVPTRLLQFIYTLFAYLTAKYVVLRLPVICANLIFSLVLITSHVSVLETIH